MASRRLGIRALEKRIVFDAAAATAAAATPADDHAAAASLLQTLLHDNAADASPADHTDHSLSAQVLSAPAPTPVQAQSPTAIVFVDTSVKDYRQFVEQSPPGALVVMLDPREDGVSQIADTLGRYSDVQSVHIISHGAQGELHLGSTVLDADSLGQHAGDLAVWNKGLADGADILLYGCDVGAGSAGQSFIDGLAALTGADVAASTDPTGSAALGGDWELESLSGAVETGVLEAPGYGGLLAAPTFLYERQGTGFIETDLNTTDNEFGEFVLTGPDGSVIAGGQTSYGQVALVRYAADGSLDSGFGAGGVVLAGDPLYSFSASAAVLQSDGKIVVAGTVFDGTGVGADMAVWRFNADGTLDAAFGLDGLVRVGIGTGEEQGYAVALDAAGRIVVAGKSQSGAGYDVALIRLSQNGDLDASFDGDGKLVTDISGGTEQALGIAIQADGRIVVAGNHIAATAAYSDVLLVRYNSDGSLDSSFGTAGSGISVTPVGQFGDSAEGIAIDEAGNILLAGFTEFSGTFGIEADTALLRFTPAGTLDSSFGANGDGIVRSPVGLRADRAEAITLQSDGSILLAGVAADLFGVQSASVLRFDSSGSPDTGFGDAGGVLTPYLYQGTLQGSFTLSAVSVDPGGRIVAAGSVAYGLSNLGVLRLNPDGSPDTSFGTFILDSLSEGSPTFFQVDPGPITLAQGARLFDADLSALSFGFGDYAGLSVTIAREGGANADDVLGMIQTNGTVYASGGVLTDSDGFRFGTYSAGTGTLTITFDSLDNAASQEYVNATLRLVTYFNAALLPPTSVSMQWTASDGSSTAVGKSQVTIVPINEAPSFDGDLTGDGITIDTGSAGDLAANAVIRLDDGKYLVTGSEVNASGNYDFALRRYNADGTPDTTFGDGGAVLTDFAGDADEAYAITVQPDGRILVAGSAVLSSGTYDFAVARYTADGQLDGSFGTAGIALFDFEFGADEAYGITVMPDGSILLAGDAYLLSLDKDTVALVKLDASGALDPTFGSGGRVTTSVGAGDSGYSLAVDASGRVLVAGESFNGTDDDFLVVRYLADGNLDSTFGVGGSVVTDLLDSDSTTTALTVQADGSIVVVGNVQNGAGDFDIAVVRYLADGSLDAGFGTAGVVTVDIAAVYNFAAGVAMSGDKIVVTGSGTLTGGTIDFPTFDEDLVVLRLNADGSLDAAFGDAGIARLDLGNFGYADITYDSGNALVIDPDGAVVVAGTRGAQRDELLLVRFLPDGTLDPAFGSRFGPSVAGTVSYPLLGAPVVLDPSVSLRDREAILKAPEGDYTGISVTVMRAILLGGPGPGTGDSFGFSTSGALFDASGGLLSAGGVEFGSYNVVDGALTISFSNSLATQQLVDDVLSRITFANDTLTEGSSVVFQWLASEPGAVGVGSFAYSTVLVAAPAHATWDGGAGTSNWGDAANWSYDTLPTALDDATIIGATVTLSSGSYAVNTLTVVDGQVSIGGGTLSVGDDAGDVSDLDATSQLALSGGTLTLGGYLYVDGSYTQTGGVLGGSGTLTLTGSTNTWSGSGYSAWTGGGTVVVANGASLTFSGSGVGNVFSGHTLDIASGGTVTVAGNIELDPGTNVINNAGTLNLNSGDIRHTSNSQGSMTITNSGVINKNGVNTFILGSTPFDEAVNLINAGTFNLNAGTLNYAGGTGSSTGTFNVALGGTYETSGTANMVFGAGSVFSSAGTILTSRGSVTFAMATANFTQTGSITTTSGQVTFTPSVNVSSITILGGNTVFNGSATTPSFTQTDGVLSGSGTLTLTGTGNIWSGTSGRWAGGGTVVVADGAAITLSGSGLFGNTFGDRTLEIGAGGTATVSGRIELDLGTNAIINAGTLNLNSGDIRHTSGSQGAMAITNTGVINKNGANTFILGSTPLAEAVNLSNAGTLNLNQGTLNHVGGTGSGPGTYNVASGATFTFGNPWSFGSPASFTGAGLVNFSESGTTFSRTAASVGSTPVSIAAADGPFTVDATTPAAFTTAHGSVAYDGTNFVYTAQAGYAGADSFSYVVRDTGGLNRPATVTVNLTVSLSSGNTAPSFEVANGTGIVLTPGPGSAVVASGNAVLVQPDGRILVAGSAQDPYTGTGQSPLVVTRYLADGSLDTTFGSGGSVTLEGSGSGEDQALSIQLAPDGRIVVAGYLSNAGFDQDYVVIRLNTDGSFDTGFDGDGVASIDVSGNGFQDLGRAVTIDASGRILVAGQTSDATGEFVAVLRLGVDGAADSSFGNAGIARVNVAAGGEVVSSIVVQDTGRVVVGGAQDRLNGDFMLVALTDTGALDTTFGSAGTGIVLEDLAGGDDRALGMALAADGSILVAGYGTDLGGVGTGEDAAVLKFTPDGLLDTNWPQKLGEFDGRAFLPASGVNDRATGIAINPTDGSILLSGVADVAGYTRALVMRISEGGRPSSTFGAFNEDLFPSPLAFSGGGAVLTSTGSYDAGYGVAVQSDGKVLVTGISAVGGGAYDQLLIRYNTDGTLDSSFGVGTPVTTLDGTPTFTQGGAPVILDANVQITDAEMAALNGGAGNYTGASLVVGRDGGADGGELWSFDTTGAPFTASAGTLRAGGLTFATYSTLGGELSITFTSSGTIATQALVNAVMQRIMYANDVVTGPASVPLVWQFSDGTKTVVGGTTVAIQAAANQAPVASNDTAAVIEDATTANLLPGLLANDSDADGDVLSVTTVTQGSKGSVLLDNRGTTDASDDIVTYTADGAVLDALAAGQTTIDTFSYTVSDPSGLTSTATVTVTITGTNDAPTSPGASFEVVEGQSTSQYAVVFAEGITWSAARDAALALGGGWDLATVTSAAEDALVVSLLPTNPLSRSHFYIGADIDAVTGAFTWVSGEPFVYTNWGVGQPSGGENTLAYDFNGGWGWNDAPDDLGAYGFSRGYVMERTGAGGTLTAFDADADAGDTLTFALVGTAPTGFTLDASGKWSVDEASYNSLAGGQTQTLTVPYTVTDASGASSTASLVITITGTNDAPLATGATVAVLEDGVVSGALPATDPDTGDTLTFSSNVTALPGFTLDAAGNWSFDASSYDSLAAGQTQTLTIPYTVTDAGGLSSSASLVITITGTNDAPVSPGATASVLEDATVSGTLSATDADAGDTLSFALLGTAPAGVTLDAAGNWSFDASSYDSLAAGQTLTLTVAYTVEDVQDFVVASSPTPNTAKDPGGLGSTTASLVITITGTNDAPLVTGATVAVLEDGVVSGALPATDPDTGDTLTFSSNVTALPGFTLDAAGNWSFDASSYDSLPAGQTLTLTVPYTVIDADGLSSSSDLLITITGTNDAPLSSGATASVLEDGTVSGTLTATDADTGDTRSFALTGTAPTGFSLDAAGNWSFDASSYDSISAGQTQTVTVPYTVTDAGGLSSSASVVITITGTNDAALLGADAGSTVWGTPVAIDVLANDSDIDNALAVTAITQGTNGSVKILADGRVEYTPTPGFTGTDAFTYTVTDGSTQSVTVTVARGDLVWTNATGDNNWNNPGNWDQGLAPTAIDTVVVPDAVGAPQLSGGATLVALHLSDTLTISDGTLTLTGASTIESTGNLVLDGSTLDGSAVLQSSGTLTLRGGTVTLTLDNAGLLIAEGGGVVDQGAADFVNSGTIIVPPDQNLQIVAGQFINRGDVKGHGTIDVTASLFLNDGAVSPGSSPGILTVSGNYMQTGAGVLNIELAGPIAGTQYDQLIVSGTATLAGNLNLILLNGFVPGPNDGIQILSAGSIVGDFGSISGLPPGITFSVSGGFGQSVPPVIPGTTVFSTTPVAVVYIGVVSVDPAIYGSAPEQTWIYQALAPPPEDYMVGDLEWQDMMEDIMATIAGEDVALTDTGERTLTDATNAGGAQPEASLEAQLRAIADQFTDEQQQILDQLRAAEELLTCP